jgi:hypothetical protein
MDHQKVKWNDASKVTPAVDVFVLVVQPWDDGSDLNVAAMNRDGVWVGFSEEKIWGFVTHWAAIALPDGLTRTKMR